MQKKAVTNEDLMLKDDMAKNNLDYKTLAFNLENENKKLKDVLVNMLMQKELLEIKNIDNTVNSLEDMDLKSYFALRNQSVPINVAVMALRGNKNTQPSIGDIKGSTNFEKQNRYKDMPKEEFLKEIEKAMRGELM